MNNRFLLILAGIIIVLGGVFFFTREDTQNSTTTASPSNHVYGKVDSTVTLVEFADFQCPACKAYFPVIQQLKETYKDRVAFQFRHFPLVQIHPNAMAASRAAEAAGKQGKFWEMHDLLFQQQDAWAQSQNAATIFEDYATQLGLNVDQFKTDVAAQSTLDTINADVQEGQKSNVSATPTFVLNGQKLEQAPQTFQDFAKLLDEALQQNQ